MIYHLGPRSGPMVQALRLRIVGGDLPPGARLPSLADLVTEFAVAPLTARHAIAALEAEGLVLRQARRGTFVQTPARPTVLIVDDEAGVGNVMRQAVNRIGYAARAVTDPAEALELLDQQREIALILSDIRMPAAQDGVCFIRACRQRWPDLPLAAVTGFPGDLAELFGTPECPTLVLAKPFRAHQLEEVVRLALRSGTRPPLAGATR